MTAHHTPPAEPGGPRQQLEPCTAGEVGGGPDGLQQYLVPVDVDVRVHAEVPVEAVSPEAARAYVEHRAPWGSLPWEAAPGPTVVVGDPVEMRGPEAGA